MFLPRALQLRTIDPSDAAAVGGKRMTTSDVASLVVAYLRKRGLTKTLQTFVAETSLNLKEIGGPLEDDLDEIYGSYLSAKSNPEKRKINNGALKSPVKKKKVKLTENGENAIPAPVKQKVDAVSKVKAVSPSSSEDSESSSEEEEQGNPQTAAAKVSEKRKSGPTNGVAKQVSGKLTPIATKKGPSNDSDSEDSDSSSGEEKRKNSHIPAAKVSEKRSSGAPKVLSKQVGVKPTPIANTESSSDESDSEDSDSSSGQEKQKRPQITATKISDKGLPVASSGLSKQVVVKPTPVVNTESSSDESDSEDSDSSSGREKQKRPQTTAPKISKRSLPVASSGLSKQVVVKPTPVANNESSSDESDSEDTDSSSGREKQKRPQTTAPKVFRKSLPVASSGKQATVKPSSITGDGSSSDESDSEKEVSRAKEPVKKQELAQSVVKPALAISSEGSDSDSEEEADAGTIVAKAMQKMPSNVKDSSSKKGLPTKTTGNKGNEPLPEKVTSKIKKTAAKPEAFPAKKLSAKIVKEASPVITTAKIKEALPVKTGVEKNNEARTRVIPKPAEKVQAKAANTRRASSSSSSDSDSSSEEEPQPVKIASNSPSTGGLKVHGSKRSSSSTSSSEDSDSSDAEEAKTTKVITKTTEKSGTQAPKPPSVSVVSSSDDSDTSEDIADKAVLPAGRQVAAKPVVDQALASASEVLEQEKKSLKAAANVLENLSNGKSKAVVQQPTLPSTVGTSVVKKVKAVKTKVMAPSKESSSSSEKSGDDAGEPTKKPNALPSSGTHKSNDAQLLSKESSGTKRKRGGDQGEVEKSTPPLKGDGTKVSSKFDEGKPVPSGGKNEPGPKRQRLTEDAGSEGGSKYFQKINIKEVKYADPRLQDNSYWAKNGAEEGWGAKAQMVLQNVRGKGFRHEKTKKKRGSYKGGSIDFSSHSIKFQDSDEE